MCFDIKEPSYGHIHPTLLQGVVSAVEAGLDVNGLPENFTSHWDLSSAAFFCGTIITTIGRTRFDVPQL